MVDLVVGCPVRDRMWILPNWFDHVALNVARCNRVAVVMVGDPSVDDELFRWAAKECISQDWAFRLIPVAEDDHASSPRDWTVDRYRHMVMLRNVLLGAVRALQPDLFWSLDSDILAHHNALASAVDALDRFDAVGQRCYMTENGVWCPSYCMFVGEGGLLRHDADGCFPVDCIMASKVMSPAAYTVDYQFDIQGEDIGWSKACIDAGVSLGWDGRTISKHVMRPEFLDRVDVRCGF